MEKDSKEIKGEISPQEAKDLINTGAFVIDVREEYEFEIGHLPNAFHLPLGKLNKENTSSIPSNKPIVAYCHHGVRSSYAVKELNDLGFNNAVSLAGGIDAWATEIDPTIPRY